jgi:hypothetical protein
MTTHESSVNFENLIRDLAEMYPFDVPEVVFVELVANSLDAKPTTISIYFDTSKRSITIEDNGEGMTDSEFDQYHDFAAGLKTRGMGIGFAGVGAKISFNIADRVITETRSASFSGGSNWFLKSRKKLIWEDVEPSHLVNKGTRVEVVFRDESVVPYFSSENIGKLLKRHYLPLLDVNFLKLYSSLSYYSQDLRFIVNDKVIEPGQIAEDFCLDKVNNFIACSASKRVGYGILGLAQSEYPVAPNLCGVLLCTRGKVIKADLFNQFPGSIGSRILGVVEVPQFVNFLTTSKTDFTRRGKYREFEKLYDPIRQEFKSWLTKIGVEQLEVSGTEEAASLERELKKILPDVPELADFFGFRAKKTVLQPSSRGMVTAEAHDGVTPTLPLGEGVAGEGSGPVEEGDQPGQSFVENKDSGGIPATPISRVGRRGPKIGFAEAPGRLDLAWVDGNNVIINTGHPAYGKIRSHSMARRLYSLFAIASAIQRFLFSEGNTQDLQFIDRLMAAWGNK